MNNLEKIAEMLGVKLGENFTIHADRLDPYDYYTNVEEFLDEDKKIHAHFGNDGIYCYNEKLQSWCVSSTVLKVLLTGDANIEGQKGKNRMPEVAEIFGFKLDEEFEAEFAGKTDVLFFTFDGVKKHLSGSPATESMPMIDFVDIDDNALERLLNGKYKIANTRLLDEVIKMFRVKPNEEFIVYSDTVLYSEIRAFFDSDGFYYFSEEEKKWRKGTSILRSLLTGKAHVEGQIAQNRMPEIAKLFGLEMYEDFNAKWLGGKGTFRFSDYGLAKCLGGLYVVDDYALEKILIREYILQKEEKNGK